MNRCVACVQFALLCTAATIAGPLTTVPWNGHKGAVTFTFDDACASQIANVFPSLEERKIHATFFVPGGYNFNSTLDSWREAARAGHEVANHTASHADLSALDSTKIEQEIRLQDSAIKALDPSVESVTLAYPFCNTNELVNRIANRHNIIARTCGGNAQFAWNTRPSQWMSMTSFILQDDATTNSALTEIDNAARDGSWFVTLNHGVGGDWMFISTEQMNSLFDRAIQAGVWVGTYQEIAAYWRASKTIDTLSAASGSTAWDLKWISPHPKMPRRVPLRIRLDPSVFGAAPVVSQGSKRIDPQSDGSFEIDFMALGMTITKAGTDTRMKAKRLATSLTTTRDGWRIHGIRETSARYTVRAASGESLASGLVDVSKGDLIPFPSSKVSETQFLELRSVETGRQLWSSALPPVP
ncbi:MAG: polysaccharide deacetylase family protein [Fibrobacteria bacterium]|nr:polysaccharide deacetylase family protein [Fibrobacteria bacterium]